MFDLDRTLIAGSSLSLFGRLALEQGLIRRRDVGRDLLTEAVFARRGLGAPAMDRVAGRLLALVAGRAYLPLVEIAEACAEAVSMSVFSGARWLIDQHKAAGHMTMLVSASPQEVVADVAARLGIDAARGTVLEVEDGTLTGRLEGPVCSGVAKVEALAALGPAKGAQLTAYADSATDLPLLESVHRPVAVNPDSRLRSTAVSRGWPILRFC